MITSIFVGLMFVISFLLIAIGFIALLALFLGKTNENSAEIFVGILITWFIGSIVGVFAAAVQKFLS